MTTTTHPTPFAPYTPDVSLPPDRGQAFGIVDGRTMARGFVTLARRYTFEARIQRAGGLEARAVQSLASARVLVALARLVRDR